MDIFLSLGSNLPDPEQNVKQAIRMLESEPDCSLHAVSPHYLTSPEDFGNQDSFVNCVVWIRSNLSPRDFHSATLRIEKAMGKAKTGYKGPRRIDIDILLYGDAVIETDDLTIPHPRMHRRRFVLKPLVDLDSRIRHPLIGRTVRDLMETLPRNPAMKVIPL